MRFGDGYRVPSARLRGWDYATAGRYFVTICTRDRGCWLGKITDGKVSLSEAGRIVAEELHNTEKVRANVGVDRWIVMPDHLHAIIVIEDETPLSETPHRGVSTGRGDVLPGRLGPGSLGSIVGQFKSVCTKRIREGGLRDFAWQPRFYDHIIRDEVALQNIRKYIEQNPSTWSPPDNPYPP